MSDFHFVDSTILIDLGTEAVDVNPTALDALYAPNRTIVITTTIYDEVTTNPTLYPNQAAIKDWLDAGIDSGRVIREPTPGFPAGVNNTGELSLVDVANKDYYGQPVTFVSNDSFFDNFEALTTVPNQQHYSHQTLLLESLFEGGLSAGEYYVAAENMQYYSRETMPFTPGQTIIGTNGVVIEPVSTTEVVVTSANGTVTTLNSFERFSIDSFGNVEKLGLFIPGTGDFVPLNEYCFGGEVPIDMWPLDPDLKPGPDGIYNQDEVRAKVWKKPIELIEVGDIVVSFDDNDNLVPGPVTRTFQNSAKILLDFHGTRVTPGHVYYRPDSKKSYKYETLIDVLRDDGMIKHQDGTLIRAATNVVVDSPRDAFVQAVTQTRKADGTVVQNDAGRIRLGTRFLVGTGKERKSWAVADLIEAGGGVVGDDELIRVGDGEPMPFLWDFGDTLPKPEDFVLACSGATLEDIYKAAEWESQGPRLPAPVVLDRGPVQPLKGTTLSAMPRNEPLDVTHSPMASAKPQRALNRKQRKAIEAKQRKAAKSQKGIAV